MVPTNGTSVKERVKAERMKRRRDARTEAHRQRNNQTRTIIEFQPDAVELEKQAVAGGARWTLYVACALMVTAVGWSIWAQVDKVVVGQGKLVTTVTPVTIQPASSSPIKSIEVKFGDKVRAGQVLATLDPTFSDADVKQNEAQKQALEASIARLSAERDRKPFSIDGFEDNPDYIMQYQVYLERQKAYRAKLEELESMRDKVVVQQQNNESDVLKKINELKIYRELEATFVRLQKKSSASEVDVLSRRLTRSQAETELTQAKNRRGELDAERNTITKQAQAYIASWRTEVAGELLEATQKLSGVEQELNKVRRVSELVELRVPDNLGYKEFMVLEVAERSLGSMAQSGEALFRLIPLDVPFEVEVEINGRDIALIDLDKEVAVKLDSFPFQKHGTIDGTVRTISEGSFEKEQMPGMAFYRVRIQMPEEIKMDNVPDNFRLMPGMNATAEIKVGKRRVIEYILYPLLKGFETMREP